MSLKAAARADASIAPPPRPTIHKILPMVILTIVNITLVAVPFKERRQRRQRQRTMPITIPLLLPRDHPPENYEEVLFLHMLLLLQHPSYHGCFVVRQWIPYVPLTRDLILVIILILPMPPFRQHHPIIN